MQYIYTHTYDCIHISLSSCGFVCIMHNGYNLRSSHSVYNTCMYTYIYSLTHRLYMHTLTHTWPRFVNCSYIHLHRHIYALLLPLLLIHTETLTNQHTRSCTYTHMPAVAVAQPTSSMPPKVATPQKEAVINSTHLLYHHYHRMSTAQPAHPHTLDCTHTLTMYESTMADRLTDTFYYERRVQPHLQQWLVVTTIFQATAFNAQ